MNKFVLGREEVGHRARDPTFKVYVEEAELTMEIWGGQRGKGGSKRDQSPGSRGRRLQWSAHQSSQMSLRADLAYVC